MLLVVYEETMQIVCQDEFICQFWIEDIICGILCTLDVRMVEDG